MFIDNLIYSSGFIRPKHRLIVNTPNPQLNEIKRVSQLLRHSKHICAG